MSTAQQSTYELLCRSYPEQAQWPKSLIMSPANAGLCRSPRYCTQQHTRQPPIKGPWQCHACKERTAPETHWFCHGTCPVQYNSCSNSCSQSCCSSASISHLESNAKMLARAAFPERYQVGVDSRLIASQLDNHASNQHFRRPFTPQVMEWPAWTNSNTEAYHCTETGRGGNSPSQSTSSIKASSYSTPLTAPSAPTTPEIFEPGFCKTFEPYSNSNHQNFSLDSSFGGVTGYSDVIRNGKIGNCFQADIELSGRHRDKQAEVEPGWFGYAPANVIDLQSSLSVDEKSSYGMVRGLSKVDTGRLSKAVPESVSVLDLPTVDQQYLLDETKQAEWDSFLNVSEYPLSLSFESFTSPKAKCDTTLELFPNRFESSLPMLEDVQALDQTDDIIQSIKWSPEIEQPVLNLPVSSGKPSRSRQSRRDAELDCKLIEWKQQGLSYKEIKQRGGFREAESTLRGRYRTLTKHREDRVRKPAWPQTAVDALFDAVKYFVGYSCRRSPHARRRVLDKVPWKKVAEWMVKERGCYRYGNATVKKKYQELQQDHFN